MNASRHVDEWTLRQQFNKSGLFERAQRGELLVTMDEHDASPDYNQPLGTKSQTIHYYEVRDGRLVKLAILHQFVLPSGKINNRAQRPDPKFLLVGNEIWKLSRKTQAST